jgi:hypothetical protein
MWRPSTRRVAGWLFLIPCTLSAACGRGGGVQDEQSRKGPQIETRPVTLTVQMTGLLLMVPPKGTSGATHVLAPHMTDHFNLIGFRYPNTAGLCFKYNSAHGICYMRMDSLLLDSIGTTAGSANTASLSRSVVNLTQGSGGTKIDTESAVQRSRSAVRLFAGTVGNPCSLESWRFDPAGWLSLPWRDALHNRLDWSIPNLNANTLDLVFKRLTGGGRQVITLYPVQDTIELLLLNVPPADTVGLFSQPQDGVLPDPSTDIRPHFDAFYELIGVPAGSKRRYPEEPIDHDPVCPITVLDLFDDTNNREQRGIRTQSCITASARAK